MKAILKDYRQSPRKVRLIADLVRGKKVADALTTLRFVDKRASGPFAKGELAYTHTEKTFRVSPFNKVEGHYGLRATLPADEVSLGVALTTTEGPIMKAYFRGRRRPLSNAMLMRVFLNLPLMTLKVLAAIHWEALKLWAKGLKLQSP